MCISQVLTARHFGSNQLDRAPITDRLADLRGVRLRIAGKIGDRARNFQHPVIGSRRPVEALAGLAQQALSLGIGAAEAIGLASAQHLVGAALARQLSIARGGHAPRDHRAGLGRARAALGQLGGRQRGQGDLQVDAIHQRSRQLAQIARGYLGRAAAAARGITAPAAGTGVHRRDQLAGGGEVSLQADPRDRDAAGFERLAQHLQHVAIEFGN